MENTKISRLKGQIVTMAEYAHDYVQINFSEGDILNIYNKYQIISKIDEKNLSELTGLIVNSTIDNDKEICLVFEEKVLQISLEDDAYQGPEAAQLILSSGSIVVWS